MVVLLLVLGWYVVASTCTVTFKDGHSDLRRQSFSFSVSGLPKCGDMVKNGPDHITDEDFEGTVQNAQMHFKEQN